MFSPINIIIASTRKPEKTDTLLSLFDLASGWTRSFEVGVGLDFSVTFYIWLVFIKAQIKQSIITNVPATNPVFPTPGACKRSLYKMLLTSHLSLFHKVSNTVCWYVLWLLFFPFFSPKYHYGIRRWESVSYNLVSTYMYNKCSCFLEPCPIVLLYSIVC